MFDGDECPPQRRKCPEEKKNAQQRIKTLDWAGKTLGREEKLSIEDSAEKKSAQQRRSSSSGEQQCAYQRKIVLTCGPPHRTSSSRTHVVHEYEREHRVSSLSIFSDRNVHRATVIHLLGIPDVMWGFSLFPTTGSHKSLRTDKIIFSYFAIFRANPCTANGNGLPFLRANSPQTKHVQAFVSNYLVVSALQKIVSGLNWLILEINFPPAIVWIAQSISPSGMVM